MPNDVRAVIPGPNQTDQSTLEECVVAITSGEVEQCYNKGNDHDEYKSRQ